MKALVLMMVAAASMSYSFNADAKMSRKKAKAACKAEMPDGSKADIKACVKGKLHK